MIVLSGCVSNTEDKTDANTYYEQETTNYETEENINNTDIENNNSADNSEENQNTNEDVEKITHCIVVTGPATQEFYFAEKEAVMITETENGGKNIVKIDEAQSCAWDNKTKACTSIEEAGGFESIKKGWKDIANLMGECNTENYNKDVFTLPE